MRSQSAKLRRFVGRWMVIVTVGSVSFVSPAQSPDPRAEQDAPQVGVRIESNLVVVRVVVLDAQGRPIENLKKKDFRLFDRGKEQSIWEFEALASSLSSNSETIRPQPRLASPPSQATSGKFLALYFDDLNSSDGDLIQVRDAADHYLDANLQPQDRVAIFTSKQMLSDFTSDHTKIREGLSKLHVSTTLAHYCPDLSDYQAVQITEGSEEALGVATDEAAHCDMGVLQSGQSGQQDFLKVMIRALAQNIVNQGDTQSRTNLHQLEETVKYVSQMPGERTLILVSPGFLSQREQFQLDRLIDRALRAQVVISALDPKGLATLMREGDTTRSYIPINPKMIEDARHMDSRRESAATAVLADVAEGTGGEFFRNSNDLKAGLGALAGPPTYYILAFVPPKLDGKFHKLEIKLTRSKGTLRTRRGYFAVNSAADETH